MSINDAIIYDTCPKCGGQAYSEGVNNGIGYVYPPLHCECGWSELCSYQDENSCKKCDQYEKCFKELKIHEQMLKEYEKFRNKGIYKYPIKLNNDNTKDIEKIKELLDMLGDENDD